MFSAPSPQNVQGVGGQDAGDTFMGVSSPGPNQMGLPSWKWNNFYGESGKDKN